MKRTTNISFGILLLSPMVASAAQLTVTVDADNDYALYTGNGTQANTFYGNQYNSTSAQLHVAQSYNVTVNSGDYIYIAAWSDLSSAQGLLVDISDPSSGNLLLPSGSIGAGQWQVAATGMTIPASSPPPDVYFGDTNLVSAIAAANAATDPSGGWVTPTDYTTYDNAQGGVYRSQFGPPGIVVPLISPTSEWMWYLMPGTGGGDLPFAPGTNEDEYLIFRLPAAVPEPGTAGLMTAWAVGTLAIRRRKFI